jgi:replicative DNA helicase
MPKYSEEHLPTKPDAERFVLGSILLDGSIYHEAAAILERGDFSIEKHRRIFQRMADLAAQGKPIDRVLVAQELQSHGELESVDGLSYLVSLDEGLPNRPHIESYCQIVKDASVQRELIFACQHLINRAMLGEETTSDLLKAFSDSAVKLSTGGTREKPVSTTEMIETEGVETLLSPRRHGDISLPWPELDQSLAGISGGQVILLMAATSRGKTSMALQAATHVGRQKKSVLIWNMEMSNRSLFRRMVVQISGVPVTGRAAQMSFAERDQHRIAIARLMEGPIYFDRYSRSVTQFHNSIRQVKAESDLGLIVVDYLQLIRSNTRQNRAQQVSENSRNLKLAAMDFDLPILILSQVDRASVKGEGEIGLHSGKESGDIENDADVVLWIKSKKELSRDQPTPVTLMVGKQREGAAGFGIKMFFHPTSQTFQEVTDD